jgi:hypothetical protein
MPLTKPRKSSDLGLLTISSATGLLFSAIVVFALGLGETIIDSADPSQLCQDEDQARVVQLVKILQRNRPTDAPVLERAVDALNIARRECLHGWSDVAAAHYDWLTHWLDEQK